MFVDRDGVKLFYDTQGQGEPALVFLHGWLMSHEVWRNQVTYFVQHARVVTLDLRGFGQSDKPAGEYTFEVFADDLHFLLRQLGIHRPVLVGWSKGASIGLVYAAAHPDDLAALVLVGGGPKFIATDDFVHGLPGDVFAGLLGQFEADFSASVQDFISAMLPEVAGENPLKDRLFDLSRRAIPAIALNSIRNDARCDLRPLLPGVRRPVFICCGDQDTICPPGGSRYMRDHLPNARLHIFPGLGHAPFLTDPAGFNRQLADFIAGL